MTKEIIVSALVAVLVSLGASFYFAQPAAVNPEDGSTFGSGSRSTHGLSADATSPVSGQVRGTTFTATGASTFGGAASFADSLYVAEGFSEGGGWFSTSTTGVLTQAQLLANNGIYVTATGAGQGVLSLTLPASSTMTTLIPNAGDCRTWNIDNSQVAAATTTTIVKGTGWDLAGLDATGAGAGADVIDGLEYGRLVACREKNSDVIGYLTEWIAAD